MDQRGSLQKALAKEKGADVTDAMMEEFKTIVTEVLTPHATAILLDAGILFVTQAAVQSIVVATLVPSGSDALLRWTDALIGGAAIHQREMPVTLHVAAVLAPGLERHAVGEFDAGK